MSNNPQNIRLSACRVRWGGRDLGLTKGGVDVTLKTETKPINVDQFGPSLVNEIITGKTLMVKCPFAETDLDTLFALMKQSGGVMTDTGSVATATITIVTAPTAADTLTVNGHVFTFVSAVTAVDQILIAGSVAATIVNLVTALQNSSDPLVQAATYVGGATTVVTSYYRSGVIGNSFTLVKSSTNVTLSTPTLIGGVDGTRNVTISTAVGTSMLTNSLPLVLHPADRADNDFSEDFTVFQAGQSGSMTYAYKIDAERIYMVEFTGFPNYTNGRLAKFGI